jgi:hypothetical protein
MFFWGGYLRELPHPVYGCDQHSALHFDENYLGLDLIIRKPQVNAVNVGM